MSVKIECSYLKYAEGETLLDAMSEARIFCVTKQEGGLFVFMETCDRFFTATLSKGQVLALADELRLMALGA